MAQNKAEFGVWGGPSEEEKQSSTVPAPGSEAGLVYAESPISTGMETELALAEGMVAGAIQDPGRLYDKVPGSNLLIYKVQKGDTIAGIASNFGISAQVILSSNPDLKPAMLRTGQKLTIAPASDTVYELRPEESLDTVAKQHGLTAAEVREFNQSIQLVGATDQTIVLPVSNKTDSTSPTDPKLPSLKNYAMPTTGFNWGKLHNHNAVDIANACGTQVVAAQEGVVIEAESEGWNGGYGSYVKLEHANGTKTRYAHLQSLAVKVGDFVERKEAIGTMGTTGESTGCHLHFEVEGAQNPFAK